MPDTVQAARERAWQTYLTGGGVVELERQVYDLDQPWPNTQFSLLPFVRYVGTSSKGTILRKVSSNGPMFYWAGETDGGGTSGPASEMALSHLRLDYGDRPLNSSDIAIHIPNQAGDRWPALFAFQDLRIYGAHHAIFDTAGSLQGGMERLFLEKCSRGIELALGTTRRLVNIHCMGSGDAARDCFALYLNNAKTTHLDTVSVDDWRVTMADAPVVIAGVGGGRFTAFHAENNTVNSTVVRTISGPLLPHDGEWGTGNLTHGGQKIRFAGGTP